MRNFAMISPQLWLSEDFRRLPSSDAKLAHFYFLSGPHQNSSGCCRLPDGYAAEDLTWELERYREARDSVIDAGLIKYDSETSELWVPGWYRFNLPHNQDHRKNVDKWLEKIDSERIMSSATEELEQAIAERAESKVKRAPTLINKLPPLRSG